LAFKNSDTLAACVLVSSPPIVCKMVMPSFLSCPAATSSGTAPSATSPRFTQSATLVSLTRELPIGEPPEATSTRAVLRASASTTTESPVSKPLKPFT
jgi:hypothetical protein